MPKVLIVATGRKTRGGITTVLKAHETGEQWKKYHCHWVQTHRDSTIFIKILYLCSSLFDYCIRLPFFDIVHIHFSLPVTARRKLPFLRLAKYLGKKIIVHLHCGSQIDDIWNPIYDEFFQKADLGVLLSDCLKKRIEAHIGQNHDLRVIYNPCPIVNLSLNPAEKKNEILFSGTLLERKGYRDLIRAYGKIATKHTDWKLVLAGNGEVKLGQQIAKECGITDQCEFLGWVDGQAKDAAYRRASILCLPSYAEGFPMAVLDAWAYGLPVITTPVGGIPDVAIDGENMLLFSPGDVDTLAVQLERMIADENLRNSIAEESVKLAKTTFNINTINKQIGDLYESLLEK